LHKCFGQTTRDCNYVFAQNLHTLGEDSIIV
jgi:hypothetical protein